jgi:hypothetical protein
MVAKFARFPNQHLSIAVLCNEDNVVMGGMSRVNPDVFTNGIADIYLADVLGPAESATPAASTPTPVKLSAAELSEKTGLYRIGGTEFPALLTVDHGTLMVRSYYGDDVDFEITAVGTNSFVFPNRNIPFEFIPATPGQPKEWHVGVGKDARVWQPVTLGPPAKEIRTYAGDYRSDELGVTLTIQPRDSALVVKAMGRADVTITPFSKDVFVGDWLGIVKFSRDARGVVTGFTINRDVARGVRFQRVTG